MIYVYNLDFEELYKHSFDNFIKEVLEDEFTYRVLDYKTPHIPCIFSSKILTIDEKDTIGKRIIEFLKNAKDSQTLRNAEAKKHNRYFNVDLKLNISYDGNLLDDLVMVAIDYLSEINAYVDVSYIEAGIFFPDENYVF